LDIFFLAIGYYKRSKNKKKDIFIYEADCKFLPIFLLSLA